jgi:CRP-like cAMP-binding protein
MNKDFLRKLPIFEGMSEDDLEWLYRQAVPVSIQTGETLLEEGAPGDSAYIVVDGEFETSRNQTSRILSSPCAIRARSSVRWP